MNPSTTTYTQIPELPYMDMGTGFLIGLAIGYTVKKSFKLMLLLDRRGYGRDFSTRKQWIYDYQ